MVDQLTSLWNYGKTYASISCETEGEKETFYGLLAKKQHSEFDIIKQFKAESIDGIFREIPKKQHCYLSINTDKVLLKESNIWPTDQQIISEAFPGQNYSEFYIDILKSTQIAFVFLCRKTYVDSLIEEFQKAGINVLGFRLGQAAVENIMSLLPDGDLSIGSCYVEKKGATILSIEKRTIKDLIEYTFETTKIYSTHVLALGGLISYVKSEEGVGVYSQKNKELESNYRQLVFFKKGLVLGISILLIIGLVNAIFFSVYSSKLSSLEVQSQLVASQKKSYANRLSEVENKEQIVQSISNSGGSKSSFYINRIVASCPESISFNGITYQPLKQAVREDKPIVYDLNRMVLTGESREKVLFSQWINSLEQLGWTKDVTILSYSETSKSVSEFTVELNIREDEAKD